MNKPKISIIIPLLNNELVIKTSLDCVVSQSIETIEIICVDGGSQDKTLDIIKEKACNDNRIFCFNFHSNSCGYLLNQGIRMAKGKYVAFLYPGDKISGDMYAELTKIADKEKLDFVLSGAIVTEALLPGECRRVFCPSENYSWVNLLNVFMNGIYRKKFIEKNDICFNNWPGMDMPLCSFQVKAFINAKRMYVFNKEHYQVERSLLPKNIDSVFLEYESICREFRKNKMTAKRVGKNLVRNFCREISRMIRLLPKAAVRNFAEKASDFIKGMQLDGLIDISKYKLEEGRDLMNLLYDVEGYYEDVLQGKTPRMDMEFMFPYHMFPKNSRIVIYGAGSVGRLMYRQAVHDGYVKIVGIVDKNHEGMSAPDLPVKPVKIVFKMKYDYILISIRESKVAYSVRKNLERLGIPARKIKWDGKVFFRDDFFRNLYFPILEKAKGKYGEHLTFLNNMSMVRESYTDSKTKINSGYINSIRPLIEAMPESNGSRYYKPCKDVVGWISDSLSYEAYNGVAPSVVITSDGWEEQIEKIDLLLIVSGRCGFNNEWVDFSVPGSKSQNLICEIVQKCNECGIATVFYAQDDPIAYKQYIGIAKVCRYIFTSSKELVSDYIRDCNNEHVSYLNFSLNPNLHNPVGMKKFTKKDEVIYSGGWDRNVAEKCIDTDSIFKGVLNAGRYLRIIDDNFSIKDKENKFPEMYSNFISSAIDENNQRKLYKLYDWAININLVKDSQSMFSRKAYELMAGGNLLLSNYSAGVNSLLPEVFLCQDSNEIPDIINRLTPEEVYEHQIAGVRFVYRGNTCYERFSQILGAIGKKTEEYSYKVAVVVKQVSEDLRQMFDYQSYPYKKLIIEDELEQVYDEYDIIAFFKKGSYYGDFYLEDMVNGFKYTDSDYITKDGHYDGNKYMHGKEHDYVSVMPDKYRTVFWREGFTAEKLIGMKCNSPLLNGYSIDRFMYNAKNFVPHIQKEKPVLSVIVPIYNNGTHLYGKCFNSLRRSSIFSQMEIILVDDGSTDGYTPSVVRTLEKKYPNVRVYFFNDGGSGSASRPRNKGVKMATSDYITFLDPDNEAINDAYSKMLRIAKDEHVELVVGSVTIFDTKERPWDLRPVSMRCYQSDNVSGGRELIEKLGYQPMSIQAMIINRKFLSHAGIEQVEGAIGEDTLFCWQLFYYAKKVKFTSLPAHIYYAARDTSIVNNITAKFFKKYLILEKVRIEWLKKSNMMDSHMELRFASFFKYWYLKNLACVVERDKVICHDILRRIVKMYDGYYKYDDETVNRFLQGDL